MAMAMTMATAPQLSGQPSANTNADANAMATKAENIHNWLVVESYLINRETLCLLFDFGVGLVLAGALIAQLTMSCVGRSWSLFCVIKNFYQLGAK